MLPVMQKERKSKNCLHSYNNEEVDSSQENTLHHCETEKKAREKEEDVHLDGEGYREDTC